MALIALTPELLNIFESLDSARKSRNTARQARRDAQAENVSDDEADLIGDYMVRETVTIQSFGLGHLGLRSFPSHYDFTYSHTCIPT
jgi:hypothetical protein